MNELHCERLNNIVERLEKVTIVIQTPNVGGDAVAQLKADARWMAEQLRTWQQFAGRLVAFGESIEALRSTPAVPGQILWQVAQAVVNDYDSMFNPSARPAPEAA